MNKIFEEFKKNKDFLICVDSDGCTMDTMDIKHIRCFGPKMIKVWNLQDNEKEILDRWNDVNLYTLTRGINRFKGLAIALEEINNKYTKINDVDTLLKWVEETKELSNAALEIAIEENKESDSLKKALQWSIEVNEAIKNLPEEENLPFPKALEGLQEAHKLADVAIVSSANPQAVLEEWTRHKLIDHTDITCAQDAGTKAFCIEQLKKKGYEKGKILMIGDALGDYKAAKSNDVLYYPICVKHEEESWNEFINNGLKKFLDGTFVGEYEEELYNKFIKNLSK